MERTDKEKADDLAIGGMRNTAASVRKLTYSAAFNLKLGDIIRAKLTGERDTHTDYDQCWISRTCSIIGSPKAEQLKPPSDAIAAAKALLVEHTRMFREENHPTYRSRLSMASC